MFVPKSQSKNKFFLIVTFLTVAIFLIGMFLGVGASSLFGEDQTNSPPNN